MDYGEERYIRFGMTHGSVLVAILRRGGVFPAYAEMNWTWESVGFKYNKLKQEQGVDKIIDFIKRHGML